MSGLLSALMLCRAGWTVDIYERVDSELSGRGAGIVAQYELIERLRALGLETSTLGVHITTRKILDAQGRLTEEVQCQQVLTAWERVYRLLRDAFPPERYHRGRGLVGFESGANSVLARFSDGETIEADLLVGADGTRSTVRQQALPTAMPLYAGYCAWSAMIAENAIPRDTHRDLFEYMTFTLPPGEQLLGYPVAGPQFRQIVRLIEEPILQPIYDLESPRMAFGRVAILGDAAFVARPHVAAGVSKAADDAAALVEALAAEPDVPAALKRYEAARFRENTLIIERARHLGAYLQATQTQEERARAGLHSTAGAVIAETAVLDFLRA